MPDVCYLDMDGVLTDFVSAALKHHASNLEMRNVRWDFPKQIGFDGRESDFWAPLGFDFWDQLPWTTEGLEILEVVEDHFGAENVIIMTSPCATKGSAEGKVSWIKREIPEYSKRFMVGQSKHLMAGPGKILIDDYDGNVNKFRDYGGNALLIPRPWNQRGGETNWEGHFDLDLIREEIQEVFVKEVGDPRYLSLLDEMKELHKKKAADYGTDEDCFSNIRASEGIGIPAWKGSWLRARDKVKRIDNFCLKGKLENEPVIDSFMDLAAYSLISLVLFQETQEKNG